MFYELFDFQKKQQRGFSAVAAPLRFSMKSSWSALHCGKSEVMTPHVTPELVTHLNTR